MNRNEKTPAKVIQPRLIEYARRGDDALGPLKQLPGRWENVGNLRGHGWNMIAVPFAGGEHGYRLLLNQYDETLEFSLVDKRIPNRGLPDKNQSLDGDQTLAVLDYRQTINQIAQADSPESGLAGSAGATIHHEPGLWMNISNKQTNGLDLARLATIPHGDSVLALGQSNVSESMPKIPDENGLPIGVNHSLDSPYLEPYKQFDDNFFQGLFTPVHPNKLLESANEGVDIKRVTTLHVDTAVPNGGILNTPFIEKHANATQMKSTFWIQELAESDSEGRPKLRLQYTQTVFIEFFGRTDGVPGMIRWPHVSINTLEKVD